MSPGSPCLKKARQSDSEIDIMITVVFDWEDFVHHEYAPPGQAVNKEHYDDVLCHLRDAVR